MSQGNPRGVAQSPIGESTQQPTEPVLRPWRFANASNVVHARREGVLAAAESLRKAAARE